MTIAVDLGRKATKTNKVLANNKLIFNLEYHRIHVRHSNKNRSVFVHSTTRNVPYIHQSLDSILELCRTFLIDEALSPGMRIYEPCHEITNNVAVCHKKTQKSLESYQHSLIRFFAVRSRKASGLSNLLSALKI